MKRAEERNALNSILDVFVYTAAGSVFLTYLKYQMPRQSESSVIVRRG
jgi:hypothetical protein